MRAASRVGNWAEMREGSRGQAAEAKWEYEMSDRSGIFAGDDPFAISRAWLSEAESQEPNDANAIALATVDAQGLPNVRMVLLKEIEIDAFVFYTNYGSAKVARDRTGWKGGLRACTGNR